MRTYRTYLIGLAIVGVIALTAGCGNTSNSKLEDNTSNNPPPVGYGQLAINLVDAPNPAVEEIWVNITHVTAHSSGAGWITISNKPVKVDLLKLQTQTMALGLASLPPGHINQIRLYITREGNYIVTKGQPIPLKVPSGAQSGIKIKGSWEITECNRTLVTLDFDGKKSIALHSTGKGEWIMRPVIHARKTEITHVQCEDLTKPDTGCLENLSCGPTSWDSNVACTPGGYGTECTDSGDCLSGICTESKCAPGGAASPCLANQDCAGLKAVCEAGICTAGAATGAGTTCQINMECLSSSCVQNICEPGIQGAPCVTNDDCASGLCSENTCASQVN